MNMMPRVALRAAWLSGIQILLLLGGHEGLAQTNLVPAGSRWRYDDRGLAADPRWRSNGWATVEGWAAGPAPLGYGQGNEATVIAIGADPRPTTVYFVHDLVLPDPTGLDALLLRLACDDGAIVYLNGTEVYRRNLPSGPVGAQTFANVAVEGAGEGQFKQYPVSIWQARPGTNRLAVELHQHAVGLADAWFDLELVANLPLSLPEIRIIDPVPWEVRPVGTVRFQVETSDRDGFVQYVRYWLDGQVVGESSAEPFDVWWSGQAPGRHRVVAEAMDNSGRRRESAPVHFQLGPVTETAILRGPYLQSGSSTSVVVRWRTDWLASSWVRYGLSPGDLDDLAVGAPGIDHEVRITGLTPDTTYFYAVGTEEGALVGGAGPDFRFTTAPVATRPVRIWAIGDSGSANADAAAVRDAYLESGGRTDVWLMLGDNAYEEGKDDEYQAAVFDMYPDLLRNTVVWSTLGNHDAGVSGLTEAFPYLEIFTLPRGGEAGGVASGTELYYSFDYANIHFVCLDAESSSRAPGSPMLTWLEADLSVTEKDWIIAFWHHPPYSWGTHNSDWELNLIEMRKFALPILDRFGVDLVLGGHSHVYERSYLLNGHYGDSSTLTFSMVVDGGTGSPWDGQTYRKPSGGLGAGQGAAYVVCGCSGQGGIFNFPRHPAMVRNQSGFGSMVIDVDGLRLDVRFLTHEGEYGDWFAVDKRGPGPFVAPRLEVRPLGQGIELAWPTAETSFGVETRPSLDPTSAWRTVAGAGYQVGRSYRLWQPNQGSNAMYRLRSIAAP